MIFVLWKIIALSELLRTLKIDSKENSKYLHAVVFLAQDFGVVEKMYNFYSFEKTVYSHELEKDLAVLRSVELNFNGGWINKERALRLKKFLEKSTVFIIITALVKREKKMMKDEKVKMYLSERGDVCEGL